MDEQEKPFDTVSIVLLMIVAGFSDAADLATALLFPIPIIGQVTYLGNSFLVSPITWAVIQGWFIMKTHGKKASLSSFTSFIPVLGGLGNIVNIPGSEFITTGFAIMMANHPKAAALTTAVGGAVATGGAGAAAAGATEGAAGGAAAAGTETATAGAETRAAAGRAAAGAKEAGGTAETEAMGGRRGPEEPGARAPETGAAEKEIPPEALGEEEPILDRLRKELTEETPTDSNKKEDEDEEQKETPPENPNKRGEEQNKNNVIDLAQRRKQRQEQGQRQNVQLNDNEVDLRKAA